MSKTKKTAKQKWATFGKVIAIIVAVIALIAAVTAIANARVVSNAKGFISRINPVEYDEQLVPEERNGYTTFVTDNDLKVMQLTDVHIGGGFISAHKDTMAINAVAAMVAQEKPDLVIVTGDIAYPVPFQAGTFNNKSGAVIFATLMERLGVYWAPVFGNHDTELYSYYSRDSIARLYSDREQFPHCLFQAGPEDIYGSGNYVINAANKVGRITQSFIMMDSNSYTDNDYFGIKWKYDCIHADQVQWYRDQIENLKKVNQGMMPKSCLFFHIPLKEMQDAYFEYNDNGFENTEDVEYMFGQAKEHKLVVFSSSKNEGMFDACKELGSTQAMFFGHDHLNNISLKYKGIQMCYGYSVDYLAYSNIDKYGSQRGCTVITSHQNGEISIKQENYYQDKYTGIIEKETVSMDDYHDDAGQLVTEPAE